MGMSAAHCQGNVREFQSVWRVVTLLACHTHNSKVLGPTPGHSRIGQHQQDSCSYSASVTKQYNLVSAWIPRR